MPINAPVQAPVPGNGIATNSIKPNKFSCCKPFTPFFCTIFYFFNKFYHNIMFFHKFKGFYWKQQNKWYGSIFPTIETINYLSRGNPINLLNHYCTTGSIISRHWYKKYSNHFCLSTGSIKVTFIKFLKIPSFLFFLLYNNNFINYYKFLLYYLFTLFQENCMLYFFI